MAAHDYSSQCRLAPIAYASPGGWLEGMPPANAQFFYSSFIPIDDPLSAATMAGQAETRGPKQPLRPFSQGDNNALEKAWLGLSADDAHRKNHEAGRQRRPLGRRLADANEERLAVVVRGLAARHCLKHGPLAFSAEDIGIGVGSGPGIGPGSRSGSISGSGSSTAVPVCCEQLPGDTAAELSALFCPLTRRRTPALAVDKVVQRIMVSLAGPGLSRSALAAPEDRSGSLGARSIASSVASKRDIALTHRIDPPLPSPSAALPRTRPNSVVFTGSYPGSPIPIPANDGILGKPFVRAGTPDTPTSASSLPRHDTGEPQQQPPGTRSKRSSLIAALPLSGLGMPPPSSPAESPAPAPAPSAAELDAASRALADLRVSAKVAVGISRLHWVDLPALQMKPIYWSPINDISVVRRAIWFYRDSMLPVETAVANQLESLYRELRPWTDTWAEEVRCAVDIGAEGEEKVAQPLWPRPIPASSKQGLAAPPEPLVSSDPFCASHCLEGAAAAEGSPELWPVEAVSASAFQSTSGFDSADGVGTAATPASLAAPAPAATTTRAYAHYQVAFKDGHDAFLLKASLKPSAYYGRRPIAKICKGIPVGIPVVRGFDRTAWARIHEKPSKSVPVVPAASSADGVDSGRDSSGSLGQDHDHGLSACAGCRAEKESGQVSDLVLVAHGVGQKLAERVESFHFTHAINGFRRAINVELRNPAVRGVLRGDQNGIMVLPLNWRHTVSLEDGGLSAAVANPDLDPDSHAGSAAAGAFGLKDIEPASIPAVRSMISDVMFDIPFYMSHHKPKMIRALVREANRVYRLWCRNNPGFAEHGRVHLIAHSLGSAMALEVLSKQPTVPPPLDLARPLPESTFFEFDIKNLFLLGSPAAFFLLLERGALLPRRGRRKPGVDAADSFDDRVVGDVGTFGCLAVDNIFNILAKEDPIAYLLNGTIDTAYAAGLKPAFVPSATVGFFASIGHSLRSVVPGAATLPHPSEAPLLKSLNAPAPPMVRLPSQLELEVHDFTREEIAERKAHLLNDYGQIDFYLQSGGGPLEIQYLNMLSAHTSYWTNQDLIRMLCVEIGRHPGKGNGLLAMRAVKAAKRPLSGTS